MTLTSSTASSLADATSSDAALRRLAAERGQGWVTTGGRAETLEQWWSSVGELSTRSEEFRRLWARRPWKD